MNISKKFTTFSKLNDYCFFHICFAWFFLMNFDYWRILDASLWFKWCAFVAAADEPLWSLSSWFFWTWKIHSTGWYSTKMFHWTPLVALTICCYAITHDSLDFLTNHKITTKRKIIYMIWFDKIQNIYHTFDSSFKQDQNHIFFSDFFSKFFYNFFFN